MSKTTVTPFALPAFTPLTKEKKAELELKLDRARWWLMKSGCDKEPDLIFYSQLAMGLRDEVCDFVPTACTDGKAIKWGADFLDKLTDEEVRGTLVHECLHPAWGHLWRFDMKNKKIATKANMACDYAINIVIDKLNKKGIGIKLPDGGLLDYQYDNLAEEEIFNKLPEPPPSYEFGFGDFTEPAGGDGDKDGEGKDGKGSAKGDKSKNGSKNKDSLRDEWERRIISAAQAAKAMGQGNLPGNLQRIIDERMAQKIDWRNEMVDFVHNIISERNDWTRSPKRHAHAPVIMPRKRKDCVSKVVFVDDSSGSVDIKITSFFYSLIEQCISEMRCLGWLFNADAEVHQVHEVGPGIEMPKTSKGGGGTDFRPAFQKCQEMIGEGEEIAGLIYLTDLYGSFPAGDEIPNYPTLWLSITKDLQAPFGRTVYVEAE